MTPDRFDEQARSNCLESADDNPCPGCGYCVSWAQLLRSADEAGYRRGLKEAENICINLALDHEIDFQKSFALGEAAGKIAARSKPSVGEKGER